MSETKLLYLAGPLRCGSTLLASVLGQVPGIVDTGELWMFWRNRQTEPVRYCGCGKAFLSCSFWSAVAEAAPRAAAVESAEIDQLFDRLRTRHAIELYRASARGRSALEPYDELLGELYRAVAEVSGASVIVDSSKAPAPGLAALSAPGIEPYLLHMTRDPRSVVSSWSKPKINEAIPSESLPARRWQDVTADWITHAAVISALLARRVPAGHYRRLRYEDFVASPRHSVEALLSWLGVDRAATSFIDDRRAEVNPTHSVSGNPDRHGAGTRLITSSERWREELPLSTKLVVGALSAPQRWIYGYR